MALSVSYEVSIRHSKSDPLIVSQHQRVHHYASSEVDRASYSACWSLLECDQQFHSLEDLQKQDTSMLTIEGLRSLYNSCFTCGVSWYEDHVSLDCSECGGYAMQRPCPECDGRCESAWRRDVAASHESRKARWEGACSLLVTNPGERKKPTRQQLTAKAVEEASLAKAMEALKTPL